MTSRAGCGRSHEDNIVHKPPPRQQVLAVACTTPLLTCVIRGTVPSANSADRKICSPSVLVSVDLQPIMPTSATHEAAEDPPDQGATPSKPRDSQGWDGKLRVTPKQAVLANPEALGDPDYSDPEHVSVPNQQIEADEDLLDEYPCRHRGHRPSTLSHKLYSSSPTRKIHQA